MKLPFLLNAVAQSNSLKEVESVFGKLLKALPTLDGNTVSHCLNLISKKEINHPKFLWKRTAELLTESCTNKHTETPLSKYNVKDVCIILNSFAKVDHLFPSLIDASTKIITREIRNVHTRDLCNVIHSLGKLNQLSPLSEILNKLFRAGGRRLDSVDKILRTVEGFNEKDFSMLLRVFLINAEHLGDDAITQKLLGCLAEKYDNLSDQTLAILANSVALYGRDRNDTLSVLAPIITLRLRKGAFTPQCVAQIANGYAKLNSRDTDVFSAVSERVLRNVSEFPPRCLANVVNGLSKVGLFDKRLFESIVPQFERNLQAMTPQCIGNTINAYSKFSTGLDRQMLVSFFNKLIATLLEFGNFDSFIGQNYANILNGVSKVYLQGYALGLKADDAGGDQHHAIEELAVGELFAKLAKPIIRIAEDLNHLDVLMIANAMGRCRVVDERLLPVLTTKLGQFRDKYKNIELTTVINTLATLHACASGDTRDALRRQCLDFVEHYVENLEVMKGVRPLDIKLVLNSLARCGHYRESYANALTKKYTQLGGFNANDIAAMVDYYAGVGAELPRVVIDYVAERIKAEEQTLLMDGRMGLGEIVNGVEIRYKNFERLAISEGPERTISTSSSSSTSSSLLSEAGMPTTFTPAAVM